MIVLLLWPSLEMGVPHLSSLSACGISLHGEDCGRGLLSVSLDRNPVRTHAVPNLCRSLIRDYKTKISLAL